jgi:hypothetical protein
VQVLLFARFQKLQKKLVLKKRFSPLEADASSRLLEEDPVSFDLVHDFFDAHFFAGDLTRFCIAQLHAITALKTKVPGCEILAIHFPDCSVLAKREAIAAADAPIRTEDQLFFRGDRFGIVTPAAMERAAFEKDRRADTGSIVE